MYRSIFALALVLAAANALAGDEPAKAAASSERVKIEPELTLAKILRKHSDVGVTKNGMVVMRAPSRHVLIARVADGKAKETVCVDSLEAAEAFLAPVSSKATAAAKEK